jgi:hypothetical protein
VVLEESVKTSTALVYPIELLQQRSVRLFNKTPRTLVAVLFVMQTARRFETLVVETMILLLRPRLRLLLRPAPILLLLPAVAAASVLEISMAFVPMLLAVLV